MGERFVVVPVGPCNGELEPPDTVFSDPAPENEGAADGVVAGQRDPNTAVPILEYSREPNKYESEENPTSPFGKTPTVALDSQAPCQQRRLHLIYCNSDLVSFI
ncbi:unnamed protein product [Arctogadus glacialis]